MSLKSLNKSTKHYSLFPLDRKNSGYNKHFLNESSNYMTSKKHISKNSGYNIRSLTVIMECFSPKIIYTEISFEPKQYLLSLNKSTEH